MNRIFFFRFVAFFLHMKYTNGRPMPSVPINEINSIIIIKLIFGIAAIMKQFHFRQHTMKIYFSEFLVSITFSNLIFWLSLLRFY